MKPFSLLGVRLVLMLALALAWHGARADTPIRLFQSFAGNVNFVGLQQTVRDRGNKKPCQVFDPGSDLTATLSGIPNNATILSAQLYWAGSNYNPDFTIIFDGAPVSALSDRRYYSTTIGNGFNYYSGAVDVTEQVKKKGNAKYKFRGLTVDNNAPYCSVEGVLGGYALLVIYSHPDQPFRMLNLYEGFQYMRYNGITLNLSGFRVPNPIGSATGRVAHITWEGDATLDGAGENLTFNGYEMTDSLNPSGNQFNSRSSIDGDTASYGIDFDAYTVGSPVIKGGQTTASTRYESGQDLVLLSAEVVALPNVPLSDLSISMQLNNAMAMGKDVGYTMTVSNKGPSTEAGPTVIKTTLPTGLTFVSAKGTGWTCSSSGQVVTCSNSASLPGSASLPALTLTAKVVGSGTLTVTATVSGKEYDPVLGNNTASVEGVVSDGSARYVFTNSACVEGKALDADGQCSTTLKRVVAGETSKIFITKVVDDVPVKPSRSDESMQFRLLCQNPASGSKKASYAGKDLAECSAAVPGSWTAATVTFGEYSAETAFTYADVGRIQLQLRAGTSQQVHSSLAFVSVPYEIRISAIQGAAPPSTLPDDTATVIQAGVPFAVTVGAYAYGNTLTPNFGQESDGDAARFIVPAVSVGASAGAGSAAMTHNEAVHEAAPYPLPALTGSFGAPVNGQSTAEFKWHEVGIIGLTPGVEASKYLDVEITPVINAALAGRFIPHHFTTSTTQRMACTPKMTCPAGLDSAAYSREPFTVTVTARSENGARTMNYWGVFARDIALSAWSKPGGDQKKLDLGAATAKAEAFDDGVATLNPTYTLPSPYVHTAPQGPWGAPDSIYVRAAEAGAGVSSKLVDKPDDSQEGGIRVLNGRLLVPGTHGSERLDLPLQVSAQYWSGTHWELSSKDSHNLIDPSKASFTKHPNSLAGSVLALLPSSLQLLSAGIGKLSVNVNPAKAGSADLLIDYMPWLPSTKARLKFGTYKSPLIYLRELH